MQPRVEPIDGERWCYRVRSGADSARWYRVDLEFYDGNGKCTCKDFQTRHEPTVARGISTRYLRCKHIRLARGLVLNALIAASKRQPAFGQQIQNIVRRRWEVVMETTEEKELISV